MREKNRRIFTRLSFILACFAFSSLPAYAQKIKAESTTKGLLKIPVSVEQDGGKFWDDGKRQSFKVFIEDKEVPIKSFQGPRSPTIVLVVFDTVADLTRVDQARTALSEEINKLDPNNWIGLMRAQDGLSVIQEPTADRKTLDEKIQSIQVSGKAGLLDTLEPVSGLAMEMLKKSGVRLCVLYIADSGVANYRADYQNPVINSSDTGDLSRRFSDRLVQERISKLSESLAGFTIPIFILHLAYRTDALNLAYQSGLERIAAASGGSAILCRTTDEIKPGLENLFSHMRSSYFLGVETPAAKRSTIKLRVETQGASGKVIYPNQIMLKKK